jgi:multiple sugar transport system permease protein
MASTTVGMPRRHRRLQQRHWIPYAFILPNIVLFALFVLGPVVFSFAMSFTKWQALSPGKWVGLQNFANLLTDDVFITAVRNTILYTIGTLLPILAVSLGVAMILDSHLRGRTAFRVIVYLPVVISWVAGSVIWRLIFIHPYGVLNNVLSWFGIPAQLWTNDPNLALPSIMFLTFWKNLGFNVIIFLAGLQTIPVSLYEAGMIDGASRAQLFRRITLPLLQPTTLFALVVGVIGSFEVFVPVYLMTGGGPGYASMVLVMAVYRSAFQMYEMGYASAISVVLFFMILVVSWAQIKLFGQEVQY